MPRLPELGPVLRPTDLSEGARAAYPYAIYLAALSGDDLRSIHVCPPDADETSALESLRGEVEDELEDDVTSRVSGWLDRSGGDGGEEPRVPDSHAEVRRSDEPARAVLEYADEIGAGSIVMGTHGRTGLSRLVLGSVTEQVVRRSPIPVFTVRRDVGGWGADGLRRVLVAADLSPTMEPALRWGGLMAAATGAELEAVHVVKSPAGAAPSGKRQRILRAYRELDAPDVALTVEVVIGHPADRICQTARQDGADLVVTATHGRSGPARLVLGSVTEAVVRHARCPVLTVPAGVSGG